jgi:hypothetical protein
MSLCIACEVEIILDSPPSANGGHACKLCWYLPRMADADRAAIERALTGALGAGKIASIMTNNGRPLSKAAVQRHQAHTRQEPTTA